MAPGEYMSAGSGKLKLKGVKDSKVDKKKKKKSSSSSASKPRGHDDDAAEPAVPDGADGETHFQGDRSVMLRKLEEEDQMIATEAGESARTRRKADSAAGGGDDADARPDMGEEEGGLVKTEAERRYEEQRRRRLEERLKREGVKTHKERVEELNRYLSSLSEHHDMPRIGPG